MPKTIFITGANRGLGLALARNLAALGHSLILTTRSLERGRLERESLRALAPRGEMDWIQMDLASLDSIRKVSEKTKDRKIDVLVHVAGLMQQSPTRRLSADGFEETLAVNTLAPLLLTKELLPSLLRSPAPRIIGVTSRLHFPGSRGKEVHFDFEDPDLNSEYDPDRAYKNSKLALLWVMYELARRFSKKNNGTALAVCPGFVPETAAASASGFQKFLLKNILRWMPFATSVSTAVGHLSDLALNPLLNNSNGTYWQDGKPVSSSPESLDTSKGARFWNLACEKIGISNTWI